MESDIVYGACAGDLSELLSALKCESDDQYSYTVTPIPLA
jgi:hypothetical protein